MNFVDGWVGSGALVATLGACDFKFDFKLELYDQFRFVLCNTSSIRIIYVALLLRFLHSFEMAGHRITFLAYS